MKKKNTFFLILFSIVFFICITSIGCFYDHNRSNSDSKTSEKTQKLIDNRPISSNEQINQNFGEMSIEINQGSCEEGHLSVSQTLVNDNEGSGFKKIIPPNSNLMFIGTRFNITNLTSEYEELSNYYYSIDLLNKNQKPMLLANPAKITFSYNNDHPLHRFYAAKRNNDKWYLQAPGFYNKTSLGFQTFSFSDWILVKEKDYSSLEKAPIITASSTLDTNGEGGRFKSDLDIKVSAPYSPTGKYILKVLGRNNFPLIYGSNTFTASSSYEINLSSLSQPEIVSELATYSLTLNFKEYTLEDVPDFIVLVAEYTDPANNFCYISQKRISFVQGIEEKGNIEELSAPYVLKSEPNNLTGTQIISKDSKIIIEFSQEMDSASVENALNISPEVKGNIKKEWSDNNKILYLSCNFEDFQTYTLTIKKSAKSDNISLENDYVLIFGTPKPNNPSDTETNTATNTNTNTGTGSNTTTDTNTNTNTNTGSNTNTSTNTETGSNTTTDTNTNTNTSSNTNTATNTETGSNTTTDTNTNTGSNTNTSTNTETGSNTTTDTNTNTNTGSNTNTSTNTETGSNTTTDTNTNTNTSSNTNTSTNTETGSNTTTDTNTNTNTNTSSNTNTATNTETGSNTTTDTNTNTNTSSNTNTATNTETGSNTTTDTNTNTNTNTNTSSNTNTATNTETGSNTTTDTNTNTGSNTNTGTATEQPKVLSAIPESYSENIMPNQVLTINFSKTMERASVINALTISPSLSQGYSTSWANDKTLNITANNGWLPNSSYQVSIDTTAKDSEGQYLKATFTLKFKTVIGPLVTSISPSNQETDLPLNTPIEILFSKPMNTSLTQSSIEVFPSATLSYEWTNSNKKLRITNSEDWSEYSYIRVVIKEGVKDTDSIAISNPQSCSFRTLLLPEVVTKNCKPEPNSVSVATNTEIIVVFNKEVNKTSAESAFSLKMSNSNVAIAGNFRWEDNKMIFKPQSKLVYNYQYNVRLDATFYDDNGSRPKESTTWSFKTEENEGNHWSKLYLQNLNDLGFVPRTDHSMVTFNNSLWIIGGLDYFGNPLKDIYKSTNGSSWSLVTNTAPFGARFGHSCTVYNNKIWLSGGITIDDELGVVYLNDVWNSSNGVDWVKVTNARDTSNYVDETLFSRRAFHNMLTYKGKLWVMLGESPDGLVGDIWSSTDGITWVDRSNIDIPRKNASAIVFNDREDNNYESIFVIGGYGKDSSSQEVALNELVLFKDKNTNWSKKSENLGITKCFGSAAVVYNNRIWLIGGETDSAQNSYVSEALVSNNGINWVTIPFNSDFMPRSNHQAVIFNSMIVISGGKNSDSTFNEVWSIK